MRRRKFIALHLLLLLAALVALGADNRPSDALAVLPTLLAGLPLPAAVIAALRRQRRLAVTCLLSALIALPLAMTMSMALLYATGMSSAMSAVRD